MQPFSSGEQTEERLQAGVGQVGWRTIMKTQNRAQLEEVANTQYRTMLSN